MNCPACGAAHLAHDTRDMPYTGKVESTTIPAMTGDFCPACGEAVLGMNEAARTNVLMQEFNRSANYPPK